MSSQSFWNRDGSFVFHSRKRIIIAFMSLAISTSSDSLGSAAAGNGGEDGLTSMFVPVDLGAWCLLPATVVTATSAG